MFKQVRKVLVVPIQTADHRCAVGVEMNFIGLGARECGFALRAFHFPITHRFVSGHQLLIK